MTLALLLSGGIGADAADEHHQGPRKPVTVGDVTLGITKVAVEMAGAVTPGTDVHVELHLTPLTPAPNAVHVWIGIESALGSKKAKAQGEAEHPGGYEAQVEVPSPLPEGSKIWISIEPTSGDTLTGSVPLLRAGTKPAGHDHDHDHEKQK